MALTPEDVFSEIGGQPNSCTLREYCAFAEHVQNIASCRLLVFGVGRDSAAWRRVNHGNPTLFSRTMGSGSIVSGKRSGMSTF